MFTCPNCGSLLSDGYTQCPACGTPVRTPPPPQYASPPQYAPPPRPGESGPAQPGPQYAPRTDVEPDGGLSTSDYFWTLVLFAIPLVGLIFMVLWGFVFDCAPARRRLARAALLKGAIFFAVGLVSLALLLGVGFTVLAQAASDWDTGWGPGYYEEWDMEFYDGFDHSDPGNYRYGGRGSGYGGYGGYGVPGDFCPGSGLCPQCPRRTE